jgi:hypothetical protein
MDLRSMFCELKKSSRRLGSAFLELTSKISLGLSAASGTTAPILSIMDSPYWQTNGYGVESEFSNYEQMSGISEGHESVP